MAAKVLALSGIDVLINPQLLEEAQAYFQEKTEGKPYVSPVPADQEPPLPVKGK